MTPAEMKTLREGLGLTVEAASAYLRWLLRDRDHTPDAVRAWESGVAPAVREAADAYLDLESFVERLTIEALNAHRGTYLAVPVLVRYATAKELKRYDPEVAARCGPIAEQVHGNIIARLAQGIRRNGGRAQIVYMESSAYESWRRMERIDDSERARSAWGAAQLIEEATA